MHHGICTKISLVGLHVMYCHFGGPQLVKSSIHFVSNVNAKLSLYYKHILCESDTFTVFSVFVLEHLGKQIVHIL